MKKNDLIEKIRDTAIQDMPDVLAKIDLKKIVIDDQPETVKTPFNLRRALSYTFASLFILVSGFFLFNSLNLGTNTSPLESATEIVGFQTVSAASLLDAFDTLNLDYSDDSATALLLSETTTTTDANDPLIDQIRLVNNYLNMAETVLGHQDQYLYQSVESDLQAYAYAFRYNSTDLAGNLITYKGYYNITESDGRQVEQGLLIHEDTQFHYTTVVIQDGETLSYRYRISFDAANYVEVGNQSTDKAQRFTYRVYREGELQNQSELTLVKTKKSLQANIQITNRAEQTITLDIARDTQNSQQEFRVNYLMNGTTSPSQGNFTVSLRFNNDLGAYEYQYHINNKYVVVEQRANKGNKKATDDDFTPGHWSNNPYVTTNGNDHGPATSGSGNNQSDTQTTPGATSPGNTMPDNTNPGSTGGNRGNTSKSSDLIDLNNTEVYGL